MFTTRVLGFAGPVLLLGSWLLVSGTPVSAQGGAGQTGAMVITTDTPEYCHKLLRRVSELVRLAIEPVPREVGDLTTEGQKMCDNGQTRGGIMRLRSALLMMEKSDGPAYR